MEAKQKGKLRIKGKVVTHQPMSDLTSLRIGGMADFFVVPEDLEDLRRVLDFCKENELSFFIIGNGTKLLVRDEGFRGVIIKLGDSFKQIENHNKEIKVGAGVSLPVLINFATEKALSGIESLAGIPGTVGGAIVRNAGAFGQTLSERILSIKVLDRNNSDLTLSKEDVRFGYRTSSFLEKREWVIVEIGLGLFPGEGREIVMRLDEAKKKKTMTQPLSLLSAGCVFKNPSSFSAGFLIQQAGCAGMRIGDAQVSLQHANFIINRGKATAKDVISLMEEVQEKVKNKFGITLETELEII